ncbi:UvrD-helicase domain-containing protein [Methanoculleus taiwanensis]|uniref:UvrD-helicase domain-containing protein n=1 Tax=Methanoculleus taiwanensis TaxID=1550565 RepID=UPI000FFF52E4|nr:UvrD-helicase domain-containing protein [Methanoculleus taiwanensis]
MGLTDRQKQAALDHARSKCVTAGAGTGKTHVLVRKYIDLLESRDDLGVANILALTFTEKAAAEMKIRVREALAEKEGPRWDKLRDEFLWANISTFHSFCAQVLREFPLESGVAPGFAVLDEREAGRLRDETIEAFVYGEPPKACRDALIGVLRAVGAYELKNSLERLSRRRDAAEQFFAALAENEKAVLDAWQAAVERCRDEEFATFAAAAAPSLETLQDLAARYPGDADPGEIYLRAVEPLLPSLAAGESGAAAAIVAIHSEKQFTARMGRKQNWAGDDLDRLREAYKDLNNRIKEHGGILALAIDPDDPFTRATLDYLRDLGTVFRAFSDTVEAEKRRRGALDFTDLIDRTHRLFCDHDGTVAAHFRERFQFVLVDEFQDTDPVQIGIVCAILGDLLQASAKLFVVGDPKQSIYLFRDADVTQFRRTRDLIEQHLGGEAVPLDVNFRSTPAVVGFVNAVFGALMEESGRPWEFLYEPLEAHRTDDTGSVELLLVPKADDRAAGRRGEAELVARKIKNLVEHEQRRVYWNQEGKHLDEPRPAEYRDIAILLERRTNLAAYEWALARYGIPYHVHAGLGFYGRQEVYDLYNILRFLENDRDDVALYGLLRSPYCGFSDARLYTIARSGSPEGSLWERLAEFASGQPDPDVTAAVQLLRSWLLHARRVPPAALLARVVAESGIAVVFGGLPGGEQAAANVEKVIALVRTMEARGAGTLAGVVRELGTCIDDGEREGDAALDLTSANAVSIMTVHASKGLEFPIVVVPDLAEPPRAGGGTVMVEDALRLGVTIPNPGSDHEREETPVLTILKREYRQKEQAEQKRLFYVAATRAKDHLILCGELPVEIPATLEDGKTRMAWLARCLGLCGDVYARGAAAISLPCKGETLSIPIATDPAAISAEPHRTCAPLPDGGIAEEVPASDLPVVVDEEEHTYSASEIGRYLRCPLEYERIYRLGRTAQPIRAAFGAEDGATRGLIVHEVFRGRDPAAVLRRYGLEDAGRAREYAGLYDRFRAAEVMRGATSDHREVPFRATIGGVPFKGAIDRLVRRPDGTWVLIDYKTGAAGEDALPRKVEEYAVQMTVYRRAAEAILGQAVTPYLYFVDADRWVEARVDEERVLDAIRSAVDGIERQRFRLPACEGCGGATAGRCRGA